MIREALEQPDTECVMFAQKTVVKYTYIEVKHKWIMEVQITPWNSLKVTVEDTVRSQIN